MRGEAEDADILPYVKSDNEASRKSDRKVEWVFVLSGASTAKLNMSPCVHTQPISLAVCKGLTIIQQNNSAADRSTALSFMATNINYQP